MASRWAQNMLADLHQNCPRYRIPIAKTEYQSPTGWQGDALFGWHLRVTCS
jgi:hypothetical protein